MRIRVLIMRIRVLIIRIRVLAWCGWVLVGTVLTGRDSLAQICTGSPSRKHPRPTARAHTLARTRTRTRAMHRHPEETGRKVPATRTARGRRLDAPPTIACVLERGWVRGCACVRVCVSCLQRLNLCGKLHRQLQRRHARDLKALPAVGRRRRNGADGGDDLLAVGGRRLEADARRQACGGTGRMDGWMEWMDVLRSSGREECRDCRAFTAHAELDLCAGNQRRQRGCELQPRPRWPQPTQVPRIVLTYHLG
jgi:hypothetical protein